MPKRPATFRISSALKKIIGRELITDDFVAVFELVKNSFDAHARSVQIRFEGLRTSAPRLIIADDGKGMTPDDVVNKWLFVAYSAKHEGVEDDLFDQSRDYRNKIVGKRTFAGAKGIGRFSCDRLGNLLSLYTRANANELIERVDVDWQEFEEDSKKEFVDIHVSISSSERNPYNLNVGTILEISGLRETWDRLKIKKLRDALRKLINPNQENDAEGFTIELIVPEEQFSDELEEDERNCINGTIRNFLFEDLRLRTTQIQCVVDSKCETVSTTLTDRGSLIYRITEKCPYDSLANVRIYLFALNRSAKLHFHRAVGMHNVAYGSVFVYKNGFRLHPFGDEGDDGLGIDRRKQQGYYRNLGTRELSGRIEVYGDDSHFRETSSRNAGFIDSPEWRDLQEFFWDYALKRLEKYTIETIKWGTPPKGTDEELLPIDVKVDILEIIKKLTDSKDILDIEYDQKLLDILSDRQSASVVSTLSNLKRIAMNTGNESLLKEIALIEKRYADLTAAREEAEKEAVEAKQSRKQAERRYETERRKNIFLLANARNPEEIRDNLDHWIKLSAQKMRGTISSLISDIKRDKYDRDSLLDSLSKIKLWIDETVKVSSIVTKADFNLKVEQIRNDLGRFIYEYLKGDDLPRPTPKVSITYDNNEFVRLFRPMAITILFDNLVDNAIKAHARNLLVSITSSNGRMLVTISNDGEAVKKGLVDSLFELGISGRGGSGIGLYTCRDIMKDMNGKISLEGNDPILGGAKFVLEFIA